MHLRSRSERRQVLTSLGRIQTMFFRNGSESSPSKREGIHGRAVWARQLRHLRARLPWPPVYAKWDPFRDFLRTRLKEAAYTRRDGEHNAPPRVDRRRARARARNALRLDG